MVHQAGEIADEWRRAPNGIFIPRDVDLDPVVAEKPPSKESAWRSRIFSDVSLTLTLAGLVCYALARYPIDAFLAYFHASTHDVGLGYAEMLTPVAIVGAVARRPF